MQVVGIPIEMGYFRWNSRKEWRWRHPGTSEGRSGGTKEPGHRVVWGADRRPKTVFFTATPFTPGSNPGCDGPGATIEEEVVVE